jgi:hypothetical protein
VKVCTYRRGPTIRATCHSFRTYPGRLPTVLSTGYEEVKRPAFEARHSTAEVKNAASLTFTPSSIPSCLTHARAHTQTDLPYLPSKHNLKADGRCSEHARMFKHFDVSTHSINQEWELLQWTSKRDGLVLTATSMKIPGFWDVTACRLVKLPTFRKSCFDS